MVPPVGPVDRPRAVRGPVDSSVTLLCAGEHVTSECTPGPGVGQGEYRGWLSASVGVRARPRPALRPRQARMETGGAQGPSPTNARRSPTAGQAFILPIQPLLQRREVVEDRGGVHLPLTSERF